MVRQWSVFQLKACVRSRWRVWFNTMCRFNVWHWIKCRAKTVTVINVEIAHYFHLNFICARTQIKTFGVLIESLSKGAGGRNSHSQKCVSSLQHLQTDPQHITTVTCGDSAKWRRDIGDLYLGHTSSNAESCFVNTLSTGTAFFGGDKHFRPSCLVLGGEVKLCHAKIVKNTVSGQGALKEGTQGVSRKDHLLFKLKNKKEMKYIKLRNENF